MSLSLPYKRPLLLLFLLLYLLPPAIILYLQMSVRVKPVARGGFIKERSVGYEVFDGSMKTCRKDFFRTRLSTINAAAEY